MATMRLTRRRKDTGLRKYIVPLYTKPVLKFLYDPDFEPVRDLIYGPGTSYPSRELLAKRKALWRELRDDILEAGRQYAPDRKPWGCRFDSKG
jgi:hypothetical protein